MSFLPTDGESVKSCELIKNPANREGCKADVIRKIQFLKANPQIPSAYSSKAAK